MDNTVNIVVICSVLYGTFVLLSMQVSGLVSGMTLCVRLPLSLHY